MPCGPPRGYCLRAHAAVCFYCGDDTMCNMNLNVMGLSCFTNAVSLLERDRFSTTGHHGFRVFWISFQGKCPVFYTIELYPCCFPTAGCVFCLRRFRVNSARVVAIQPAFLLTLLCKKYWSVLGRRLSTSGNRGNTSCP